MTCSEQSKFCPGRIGEYKRYFDRSLRKDYVSRPPADPNNANCGEGAGIFACIWFANTNEKNEWSVINEMSLNQSKNDGTGVKDDARAVREVKEELIVV